MIKTLSKSLLFCLALLSALIYFFIATEIGLKAIYYFVKPRLPGHLIIEQIKGSLITPISLEGVYYQEEKAVDLTIQSIKLRWNLLDLLHKQLTLEDLIVTDINIHQYEKEISQTKIKRQLPPLKIKIKKAEVMHFAYLDKHLIKPLTLDYLFLNGKLSASKISLLLLWQNFTIPLKKDFSVNSPWGNIRLKGPFPNYHVTGLVQTEGNNLPVAEWNFSANGDLQQLNTINLKGLLLGGHLDVTGNVNFAEEFKWDLLLTGKNIKPRAKDVIQFKAKNIGVIKNKNLLTTLTLNEIKGTVQGLPVSGQGSLVLQNQNVIFENIKINLGKAFLFVDGYIKDMWQVQWNIDIPQFKTPLPVTSDALKSEGMITGDRKNPHIKADFLVKNLKYYSFFAENLNGIANLNPSNDQASSLNVSAENILVGQFPIQKFIIAATGNEKQQQINTSLNVMNHHIALGLKGKFGQQQWDGTLENFNVQTPTDEQWNIKKSIPISFAKKTIQVPQVCLYSKQGKLCSTIQWQAQQKLHILVNGENINAALLSPAFDNKIKLYSSLNFSGEFDKFMDKPATAKLNATISKGEIILSADEKSYSTSIEKALVNTSVTQEGLKGQLTLTLERQAPLTASIALPEFRFEQPSMNQTVNATIKTYLTDLSFLTFLFPHLSNIKGFLVANINLSGKLAKPNIKAEADLKQGSFNIAELGLKVNNISINAQNSGTNRIIYSGEATSGPGKLYVKGETKLDESGLPMQLSLKGQNVEITNTAEINILANPDLILKSKAEHFYISGNIFIPKAIIKPKDFSTTVTLSDDVVFVKQGKIEQDQQFSIHSDIDVSLGRDVMIDILGIKGQLQGEVKLKDSSEKGTVAFGQLSIVEGKFTKYNQKLDIQQGRLIFAGGAVDNPGIYFKAVKKVSAYRTSSKLSRSGKNLGVSQYNIGIQVVGNINEPRVTLFSEPAGLSQSEILSYLVLGTSLSQAEGGEGQILFQALQGLNLSTGQTGMIQEQLQQKLKLDQLTVASSEVYDPENQSMVQNTSLVLGKMLSPKLLLSYSIGLLQPVNVLNISYKLTDKLILQSSASTEASGIDILYSIERN